MNSPTSPFLVVLLVAVCFAAVTYPTSALAQDKSTDTNSAPDSVWATMSTEIKNKPFSWGETKAKIEKHQGLAVLKRKRSYFRVEADSVQGWISSAWVTTDREEILREIREKREQERKEKERREYFQDLQRQGYTIALLEQTYAQNTADGISVGLRFRNVSDSKTVKYASVKWRLFNSVGDPTTGQINGTSVERARFVGPLEPGRDSYVEWENLFYSTVGTCLEVRKITVEHVDGSTFTYVDDLNDIVKYGDGVKLRGGCSYEAQQGR